MNPRYDVAVVGGGPAGAQAAISAVTEGFKVVLFEGSKVGGQISATPHLENMAGYPYGITGKSFAQQLRDQMFRLGVVVVDKKVDDLFWDEDNTGDFFLNFDEGGPVFSRSVVLATGKSFKGLKIEGMEHPEVKVGPEEAFEFQAEGKELVIVGGGNSAGQAIVHLGQRARKVTVIAPELRTSEYLTVRIRGNDVIEVIEGVRLVEIEREREEMCKVHASDGGDRHFEANGCRVFVCAGMRPNSGFLNPSLIATDNSGHIITDHYMTLTPGLFAIGDVRSGAVNRVPSAIGEAANLQPHLWDYLNVQF